MQSRPSKYLLVLAFFVLVPVLIGLLLGAGRTGVAMHLPWAYGLLFWVAASLGVWLCLYLGSALAGFVLRPWQPSLWVILLVGAVLGSLPARHWIYLLAAALGQRMLNGRRPQAAPALELSWEFAIYYLQVWVGVYAVWVAAGLVFDRWFAFPAYSRTRFSAVPPGDGVPAQTGGPAVATPVPGDRIEASRAAPGSADEASQAPVAVGSAFLERLPAKIGTAVIAVEAQDHYVRVYTERGNALVLYRFSDAISELAALDGLRVHRSYWVRRDAVRSVAKHGKSMQLTLINGMTVPVSQAFKQLARESGLTPD